MDTSGISHAADASCDPARRRAGGALRPGVVAVVLLAVGCHHVERADIVARPPPRVAHELYRIGPAGASLAPEGALDDAMREARVIYVGEAHDDPDDHAVEAELLARVYSLDPSVGLGLEMLPTTAQGTLDDFVAGRIDEATFLARVDWAHTWGFPWRFYRPLLAFCREHHLPAFALNAPPSLAHAVAKSGIAGLDEAQRRGLPEIVPGPAAHRAQFEEAFRAHPGGRKSESEGDARARRERYYEAQLLWDETMASSIAAALGAPGAPRRLVVVVGEEHAERFAIPQRVERRGVAPSTIVMPIHRHDWNPAKPPDADFACVLKP